MKAVRIATMLLGIVLFGATTALGQIPVSISDVDASPGDTLQVPVEVGDVSGSDIFSYEFTITYDASLVTLSASPSGLSDGSDVLFESNNPSDGTLKVAVSSGNADPLSGSGTLADLEVVVASDAGGSTALSFTDFQFNEGSPAATTSDGSVTVAEAFITLPDISQAAGSQVVIDVHTSDLTGLGVESYEFDLPFDGSVLSNIDVVTQGTLSENATVDFNVENETLSVGAFTGQDVIEGEGTLVQITADLSEGQTDLSFSNFQFNEGNVSVSLEDGSIQSGDVVASLPSKDASSGAVTTLYVSTSDLTGQGAFTYEFQFSYDSSVLTLREDSVVTDGTNSEGMTVEANVTNGTVTIATQGGTEELSGSGKLVGIQAEVNTANTSALTFNSFQFNEGDPSVVTEDGELRGVGNAPPNFTSVPGDFAVTFGTEIDTTIVAEDPDGDPVTYSAANGFPSGAAIDSSSGQFTWTPTQDQADSTYSIGVRASDGSLSSDTSFAVTVEQPVNNPPNITSVPSGSVQPGDTFQGTVEASDPDGDDLTYSLQDPPSNASIDSTNGDFEFSPTFDQRGSDVSFTASVSDGQASADSSFVVTVEELDRGPISFNVTRSFGDAFVQSNYLLLGLPGQVNMGIDQTLEGQSGANNDWRAFWDDGSSSTQNGLIEFDGSATFNFSAGNGFWALAKNPWSASGTVDPVPLDNSANATISLHDGWNIISNPLGKSVSWSDVQSENGITQPLWSYDSGFSESTTFPSASQGEAFYLLNDGGLSQLKIPYFTDGSSAEADKSDGPVHVLKLETIVDEERTSGVALGLRSSAETGKDEHDHFAPPAYFEPAALRANNQEIDSKYRLASDMRPTDADGQTYSLTLESKTDAPITVTASGVQSFERSQEIRLFDRAQSRSYDLRRTKTVEFGPDRSSSELVVMIGSESYVKSQQSELVPQKVKLHQNYPNPFSQQTTIRYAVPEEMKVRVDVYDLLGRRVKTLENDRKSAGTHTLQWSGDSSGSGQLASGTYLVRLQAGDQTRSMKMVLVK